MTDVCGKPASMPADNDQWSCTECGYVQPGPHKDDCVCRPGPTVDEVLAGWVKDLEQVVSSMNRDTSYTRAHEAQTLLMQIDHWREDLESDWGEQRWEEFKNMPEWKEPPAASDDRPGRCQNRHVGKGGLVQCIKAEGHEDSHIDDLGGIWGGD